MVDSGSLVFIQIEPTSVPPASTLGTHLSNARSSICRHADGRSLDRSAPPSASKTWHPVSASTTCSCSRTDEHSPIGSLAGRFCQFAYLGSGFPSPLATALILPYRSRLGISCVFFLEFVATELEGVNWEMAAEEHAIPASIPEGDLEAEFTLEDCRRAFSGVVYEEKLLEKKRRWLMTSPMKTRNTHKRLRTPALFGKKFLLESFIRNDDAGLQVMRMLVQRSFRLSTGYRRLNRTHLEMGETTEESSPESHSGDHFERENMLSEILSNLASLNPLSSSLVSSVSKILEGLEALPSLALLAMNRKLKDVAVTPQFPVNFSCKRNILITRLRKRCQKILLTLRKGDQLPKPLAKALLVMFLSLKQILGQVDIVTLKIFTANREIENLQTEILQAIRLLPNVKVGELKHLQHVIAPNASISSKSLRRAYHNYLMENLFHCDELHVTKQLLMVIKHINKASGWELTGEEVTEEVEAILNLSSQLRQIVWESFPDESMDQEFANHYVEDLGDNEDSCDITIDENEDCSTFGYSDYLQTCEIDDEVEGTGDSMQVVSYPSFNSDDRNSSQLMERRQGSYILEDEPRRHQTGSPTELPHQHSETTTTSETAMTNRYLILKNICDETGLVAYKLICHFLEELVQNEGKRGS